MESSGVHRIQSTGTAGERYYLEASHNLDVWIAISDPVGSLGGINVVDTNATFLSKRYYRVVRVGDENSNSKPIVTVSAAIEFFDGRTITVSDLDVKLFPVISTADGPELAKDRVTYTMTTTNSGALLTYTTDVTDYGLGQEYLFKVAVSGYTNSIPEFPFFVDGFTRTIVLFTTNSSFLIPSDETPPNIPEFSLFANQAFFYNETEYVWEGVDLSGFETADQFISYIPDANASDASFRSNTNAEVDLVFTMGDEAAGPFSVDAIGNALLSPLYITSSNSISISSMGTNSMPLVDITAAFDINFQSLTSNLLQDDSQMWDFTDDLLGSKSEAMTSPEAFDNRVPRVFIVKDNDGDFYLMQVNLIVVPEGANETPRISLGIAAINRDGVVVEMMPNQ